MPAAYESASALPGRLETTGVEASRSTEPVKSTKAGLLTLVRGASLFRATAALSNAEVGTDAAGAGAGPGPPGETRTVALISVNADGSSARPGGS